MRLFLPLLACKEDADALDGQPEAGTLELTTPEAGAWMDAGPTTARGKVTNVESVTVAGSEALLRKQSFEARIELARGVNVVEADALDARGDTLFVRQGVLAGEFAAPDDEVRDALALRVNRGGLDHVATVAETMLAGLDLPGSLSTLNPVYSDSYGLWGWDAVTIAADIASVSYGAPRIEIVPDHGELVLTATIPDLYLAILAYGDVVTIDFDTDVSIAASEAVITGTLQVGADDGRITVALDDAIVELRDFSYDTSLLPGDVEDYILVDTIRDTLEDKLLEEIETRVPPVLDETFAGLDPSYSFEAMGLPVDLAFAFADVDVDDDGLALTLDLDVSIPQASGKQYAGYLYAGRATADVDTGADVAGAVSDNLLNLMLFEAWRGGVLDMTLSTDDGSLDPMMLLLLKAEEGTVGIDAKLPPVVVEEQGALHAQMAEVIVTIDTPGGELGDHLVLALAADVELVIEVVDGVLKLEMGEPVIMMAVRESDWGANNETVTRLLEDMVPFDTLLALLGDFELPLPTLYGVSVDTGTASRGATGVHTGLEVCLR